MKREIIVRLHAEFEQLGHTWAETGTEFWLARELQKVLGYDEWRNFRTVIEKAITACENAGYDSGDHFVGVNKKVELGSGAVRVIEDIALTRYACYLIAQNGDPTKEPIAFAQTYFAVQTRKQEIIEQRLSEVERLEARKKLSTSEKELSTVIFERLGEGQSFARIRSKGDQALFGGHSTGDMKQKLGAPHNRPLADFLPTITDEHVRNNADVRQLLLDRNIRPEELPPGEDIKKVERRLASEEKKLPKLSERLDNDQRE